MKGARHTERLSVPHRTDYPWGFTLIEIMIVVAILGVLSMIGVPAAMNARRAARAGRLAVDLRVATDSFNMFNLDKGCYPPEASAAEIPEGMTDYLAKFDWTNKTVLGGSWDWDSIDDANMPFKQAVSISGSGEPEAIFRRVDERIDDGELLTGSFRKVGPDKYSYILQQ